MGGNLGWSFTPNSQGDYTNFTTYDPYDTTTQSTYQFYDGGRYEIWGGRHSGLGGRGTNKPHEEFKGKISCRMTPRSLWRLSCWIT